MRTRRENYLLSPESPSFRAAEQIIRRLKSGRRERNFWMQRREAQNRPKRTLMPAETERPERYRRISPQKRPIWSLPGNPWFGRTGWWCAQSYANRSRRQNPNNRVKYREKSEYIRKLAMKIPVAQHPWAFMIKNTENINREKNFNNRETSQNNREKIFNSPI